MKLWLDDVRPAPEGWHHVKTAEEALALLQSGQVTEASLDHDLGMVEIRPGIFIENSYAKDGTWLAYQMVEHNCIPSVVRVHSANPVGKIRMEEILGIRRLR